MTLLLLLSALLSAITGAGSPARGPQLAVAVARSIDAQAEAAAGEMIATARPVPEGPQLATVALRVPRAARPALAPLGFGEQRRE